MNIYQNELQNFRPSDQIQSYSIHSWTLDYYFISTAGHGYLVIPKEDKNYNIAVKIANYGYKGDHAVYLEEDCEVGEFIDIISLK
jgi:hypothetical protein